MASAPEAEGGPVEGLLDLPVERGLPILYDVGAAEDEEELEGESAPQSGKSRKVNSGKLFWFIRSKSYVPIPELRRRFEIPPNEVSTIVEGEDLLYIGLPSDAASVVDNLRRQQKIGLEVSPDFNAKVVIGLYPLRRA